MVRVVDEERGIQAAEEEKIQKRHEWLAVVVERDIVVAREEDRRQ